MTAPDGISVVDLDEARLQEFLDYALAHGVEHDDSYTTPEELARFDVAAEPAVIALDPAGTLAGAASAMVDGYQDVGHARLRILHAADPELYPALIDRLLARLPHSARHVFLFLKPDDLLAAEAVQLAGFRETRRGYILVHYDPRNIHVADTPGSTVFRQAYPPDANYWVHIVNTAFAGQPARPDMTLDRAHELLGRRRVIREGTLVAWRDEAPAGVVMTVGDPDDPRIAEVETIAVVPADQGIGLGRALLTTAIAAAARDGRTTVTLSVRTENRRALSLYLDLGFKVDEVYVCWQMDR